MALKEHGADTEVVSFGHVRLWLDDLEEIDKIIRDHYPDHDCFIRGELFPAERGFTRGREFEAESIDDLGKLSEKVIRELLIFYLPPTAQRYYPWLDNVTKVQVDLSERNATIAVREAASQDVGMLQFVSRVAAQRRSRFRRRRFTASSLARFFGLVATFGLFAAFIAGRVAATMSGSSFDPPLFWFTYAMSFPIAAIICLWPFGEGRDSAITYTQRHAEAQPFFERNRDNIIISAVSGGIGLILGGVVGVITTLTLT